MKCSTLAFDSLINFFLQKITKSDIEKLQYSTIKWTHEEKRLRKIWEKKKGKISEEKWKEILFMEQLNDFVCDTLKNKNIILICYIFKTFHRKNFWTVFSVDILYLKKLKNIQIFMYAS